jgi:DNA-binding transcriptional MerR regulator
MIYSNAMLTVKQLSNMAGVIPRALHHYDQIGILKPSRIGGNGYRYYGEDAVLKLQQILFYRELGLQLEEIKSIVGRRNFEILPALEAHKSELLKRISRLEHLIGTVDNTIYLPERTKRNEQETIIRSF